MQSHDGSQVKYSIKIDEIRWGSRFALGLAVALIAVATAAREQDMELTLMSTAFAAGEEIPRQYTCEGADISPPLSWQGVPPGTQSLVLIEDDPDAPDPAAPRMTWVHWVLYDLPPETNGLPEDTARQGLPEGTREGANDWKRTGYGGPCPPVGRHRYFHKLYALDIELGELGEPTKAKLEAAMQGHVLASAELIGTYQKQH
jgi:Raf kinase inhibitor-like YbhB/YbcL family protein